MTLSRIQLNKLNSPYKSPKSSSVRRRSLIKKINHDVKFGSASKANLKVVVRIRPQNQREIDTDQRSIVDIEDDHMLVFDPKPTDNSFFFHGAKQGFRDLNKKQHKQQKFVFENVFGPESTNQEIFENTTKDLIDTILNGYNCSVFAYGATGSGKTYTMLGSKDNHGIAFLTMMELYKKIRDSTEEKTYEIGVSYLEVYNEMVKDLLEPGKSLNLHESGQQVKVAGLSLHKPTDENSLLEILERGNKNRSQHPTDSNAESSRSHAVFQVFVRQQNNSSGMSNVSIAKLSMIDLAGSERGTATGFKGVRFREGASINKSLLALGNCINALADGKSHIPYRDSKLTRLLKDSIGGNCRSVMIAAASRAQSSFEDTFNTLKYANRAKTIKTTLKKNLLSVNHHVSEYVKIVGDMREEILSLEAKLRAYEVKEKMYVPPNELSTGDRAMYEETIEDLRKQLEEKESSIVKKNEKEHLLLSTFNSINNQMKTVQRELLQMESDERLHDLKRLTHKNNLIFMNMFLFGSNKMSKGIAKSEKIVESCNSRLEYIKKRKDFLKSRLTSCKVSAQEVTQNLLNLSLSNEYSETVKKSLDYSKMEMISRDRHQSVEYLQNLLKALITEPVGTNKLSMLLLFAVKKFYFKLVSCSAQTDECKELLGKIVMFLDSSQIEWADQKHTDDSMHEKVISHYLQSNIEDLNIDYLCVLPDVQSFSLSPAVYDSQPSQRRSIMKTSSSNMTIPSRKLVALTTPIREKNDFIKQSTLSFIAETDLETSSENNSQADEPQMMTNFCFPQDGVSSHSPMPVLNETFDFISSPIDNLGPDGKESEAIIEVSENELEDGTEFAMALPITQTDLNDTYSIDANPPPIAVVEKIKPVKDIVPSKKLLSTTKSFKNILKASIKTPFKVPKTPSRVMPKIVNTPKPMLSLPKKAEGKTLKNSYSVADLHSGSNLSKSVGNKLYRNISFRTPNKENRPPLKSSVSTSRLFLGQSTQKGTANKNAEKAFSKSLLKPPPEDMANRGKI